LLFQCLLREAKGCPGTRSQADARNEADGLKMDARWGGNDMPNETPRFIEPVAGARPSHQRPSLRLPDMEVDVESPTWNAYLIIVFTGAFEADRACSGQGEGLLRRLRSLRAARRGGPPQPR